MLYKLYSFSSLNLWCRVWLSTDRVHLDWSQKRKFVDCLRTGRCDLKLCTQKHYGHPETRSCLRNLRCLAFRRLLKGNVWHVAYKLKLAALSTVPIRIESTYDRSLVSCTFALTAAAARAEAAAFAMFSSFIAGAFSPFCAWLLGSEDSSAWDEKHKDWQKLFTTSYLRIV